MKLLIIHSYYYPDIKGGAEYSLKKLAEGLTGRGLDVSVLCDTSEEEQNDCIHGVHVYRRNMKCIRQSATARSKVKRALLELYNPWNESIIQSVIDLVKPDVIYTNCLEHISPAAWVVARRNHIPIVDTQRVYILLEMAGGKYKIGNGFWKAMNRWSSRLVDDTVFISEYTRSIFLNAGFFPNASHHVIYNAIDFDPWSIEHCIQERLDRWPARNQVRFVYLGSLSEHKGVQTMLEAFTKVENTATELHIAGDGALRQQVCDATRQDPRIHYHGWLSESDVAQLLHSCDVLVCPSIWPEPFGRVILDAYKHGMPVISTKSGGLAETVVHEQTGLQIEAGNVQSMHSAMIRISTDDTLYMTCCKGTLEKINVFSLEQYLDRFAEVFSRKATGAHYE